MGCSERVDKRGWSCWCVLFLFFEVTQLAVLGMEPWSRFGWLLSRSRGKQSWNTQTVARCCHQQFRLIPKEEEPGSSIFSTFLAPPSRLHVLFLQSCRRLVVAQSSSIRPVVADVLHRMDVVHHTQHRGHGQGPELKLLKTAKRSQAPSALEELEKHATCQPIWLALVVLPQDRRGFGLVCRYRLEGSTD